MATFPTYVKLGWRDSGEQAQPIVARSEMERGVAKQRRTQADVTVTVPVVLYFDTSAHAAAFEAWVYTDAAGGAAWFDFVLPRTGATVQARIVGGDIGTLTPSIGSWGRTQRSVKLEYVKAAL
nr:hypothetical protein [uncultured Albidiferax sp.]